MSIQVTLSFESQADLVAFFTKGALPVSVQAEATKAIEKVAKAPKPALAEKAEEKPAATPPASETATTETTPEEPAATEPVAESPSSVVDYQDVAAVVIEFSKKHGRPAAVEKLKPFGISALPSATEDQYAAIKAAFESAM